MTLKSQKFYPAKYECKNMYCIKDYKGVNLYQNMINYKGNYNANNKDKKFPTSC